MNEKKQLLNELRIDRESREPSPRRLGGLGLFALAIAGIAVAYWAGGRGVAPAATVPPATKTSLSPVPASAESAASSASVVPAASSKTTLSASGYITARRMATVASRITGQLTEVLVEEGMTVRERDVLARLDDRLVQVDLRLAEAQKRAADAALLGATADLAEARRVLRRVESLEKTDYSSEAQLTEATASVERLVAMLASVRADVDVAAARVQAAREQLDLHVIRAPFDGVVTEKTAQPGEVVSPMSAGGGFTRTGVCTIVDMGSLEIEVDVNEAFIARVSVGQPVGAKLDAYPDWEIPAHVVAIIPTANRDKATVRVRIGVDQLDPRILPDMGVKVAFRRS